MPTVIEQCELGVERGPGWLFIKLRHLDPDAFETHQLADRIWSVLEQNLIYRVVLEMADVRVLRSELISQLVLLSAKIHQHHGILRLSGLSGNNRKVLEACSLLEQLPVCHDRLEAVMGLSTFHAETPARPR